MSEEQARSAYPQNTIRWTINPSVLNVTCGIPQGSVLGPTLLALYTNDLPNAVPSGSVFMYADDTTIYCIGDTVDCAVASLNKALSELNNWCQVNSLTSYSAKCEAMLLMRKPHIGPLNSVIIGDDRIDWVKHTRLLGVTIDDRLAWSYHLTDVKKSFVNKLNLLKKSSFLRREVLIGICILRSSCRQFFMVLSSGAVVLMQSN